MKKVKTQLNNYELGTLFDIVSTFGELLIKAVRTNDLPEIYSTDDEILSILSQADELMDKLVRMIDEDNN